MEKSALDIQVELYPQVLRRLAAGEHLASMQDDLEKIGAISLIVEALEKEAKNQPVNGNGAVNGATKEAIDPISAIVGGAAGAALKGPIGRGIAKLRGKAVPESEEIFSLVRKTLQEEEKARAARTKMIAAGAAGLGLGALATKALTKEPKAAESKEPQKKEGQFVQDPPLEVFNTSRPDVPPATEKVTAPAIPPVSNQATQARAVLDRIMKNFQ